MLSPPGVDSGGRRNSPRSRAWEDSVRGETVRQCAARRQRGDPLTDSGHAAAYVEPGTDQSLGSHSAGRIRQYRSLAPCHVVGVHKAADWLRAGTKVSKTLDLSSPAGLLTRLSSCWEGSAWRYDRPRRVRPDRERACEPVYGPVTHVCRLYRSLRGKLRLRSRRWRSYGGAGSQDSDTCQGMVVSVRWD